jgi:hypothetical protein
VAITLGKDATISIGGVPPVGVRNVTWSSTARTIDIEPYGVRAHPVYSVGFDATLQMELNDGASVGTLITALNDGTQVTVSGGVGAWSLYAVITSVTESASVDGVITFQVEAKGTQNGVRAA